MLTIRKRSGKEIVLPLEKLSKADRDWLTKRIATERLSNGELAE